MQRNERRAGRLDVHVDAPPVAMVTVVAMVAVTMVTSVAMVTVVAMVTLVGGEAGVVATVTHGDGAYHQRAVSNGHLATTTTTTKLEFCVRLTM